MRPKGKLLALIVMFAAVGLLTATGAFTTVEADRTAEINTAGDGDALIGIAAADQNGEYVQRNNGEFEFDFDSLSEAPSGVNLNATTKINRTMNITNNGDNEVDVSVEASGGNAQYVSFYDSAGNNITDSAQAVSSGNNITVSVIIEVPPNENIDPGDELIDTITIVAEDTSDS